jgi:hypothetical protein
VDTRLRDSRCQRDRDPPVGRIAHRPQELAWYLRDAPTDSSRLVISKDLPFSGLMPFSGHLVVTSPGHPALIDPLQLGKMGHTKGHTTVVTDGDRRFLAARPCTHVTIHDFSLVQPAPQTPGPARLGTMALLRAMFSYYPWPSRGGRRGPAKKSEAPKGAAENGPFLGVTLLTEAHPSEVVSVEPEVGGEILGSDLIRVACQSSKLNIGEESGGHCVRLEAPPGNFDYFLGAPGPASLSSLLAFYPRDPLAARPHDASGSP